MDISAIDLKQAILHCLSGASGRKRILVAVAGPPASGKTTLCHSLEASLKQHTTVAVVPMDGYHYDNTILNDQNLLDRKGAPNTFDVVGLQLLLEYLKTQSAPIATPVFDRTMDLARSSARLINPDTQIILVEGNYLLCDTPPWNSLANCFDLTISINTSKEELEKRLIQRWLDHDHTPVQAKQRAHHNDLPNALFVIENSRAADYQLNT